MPAPGRREAKVTGRSRLPRGGAVALALLAVHATAWGQHREIDEQEALDELNLQMLLETPVDVWTPTKAPQKSHQAPAIVTTVTREQIEVWGYRSLAELLSHQLGFYVVDDHTTANLVVRGNTGGLYSDSSIIKVLINGHPVSFSPTGGNGLGPELLPLSAIERVEIILGPASALYGADAFLGMINIQTREGDGVAGTTAWVAGGLVGRKPASDFDVTVGTSLGMVEALVAARRTQQDLSGLALPASSPAPRIPAYRRGSRHAEGLDQDSTSAIATVTVRPGAGSELGLFAYYSQMDRGSEFGSLLHLAHGYNENNAFSENRVGRYQLRGGLQGAFELPAHLKLSLRAAYFQGGTGDENRLEVGSEFYYIRRRLGFRGGDLDAHLEWGPTSSLLLAVGTSLYLDDEQLPSRIAVAKQAVGGVARGEVLEGATIRQGHKTLLNVGAYMQVTWQPFDERLGLTGGLRYDHHNIYFGQLSRRIGLVGSPAGNVHIKLLHGSAFQAPSPFLLYAVPSATDDVVGNRDLRPQYVNTLEAQVAWQPADYFNVSTDVAGSLLDNKTEFLHQGINKIARNVLRTATLSWENRAELKVSDWFNANLSFELHRTVIRSGLEGYVGQIVGSEGSIYPRVMVHAGVAAQLPGVLRAAVRGTLVGSRRASGNNILLNRGVSYSLPPYVLLDATITTRGFRVLQSAEQEVSFTLSGKNLLGATGPSPGSSGIDYPLSPRAFFLQANFSL